MVSKKHEPTSAIDQYKSKQKAERKELSAKFVFRKLSKNSKPQKVLEVINAKGKVISSVKASTLKKEGITKEQAFKRYINTNSFSPTVKERTKFSNGFIQTISESQYGTKKRSQIGADIWIQSKGTVYKYTGFSDLGTLGDKGKEQAKRRALVGAVGDGVVRYRDIDKVMSKTKARYFFINFNFLRPETEQAIA